MSDDFELEFEVDEPVNRIGDTRILQASFVGDFDQIVELVELGANINFKNRKGETAVHQACFGGHLEIVKYLISQGGNHLETDGKGQTPFIKAAQRGNRSNNISVMKYLLTLDGVSVNDQDANGRTALSCSIVKKYKHSTRFLIINGADIWLKNNDGECAVDLAIQRGFNIIKYRNRILKGEM